MVATLAHGYEGRDARFSDSPKRQTRDDPIEVLRRFRLNDESQSYAPSDGPAAHERLFGDELVEPRERRKDDLLNECPACVRRRHSAGFHMVDFDQEKHETSEVCLAPRPPEFGAQSTLPRVVPTRRHTRVPVVDRPSCYVEVCSKRSSSLPYRSIQRQTGPIARISERARGVRLYSTLGGVS